MNSDKVQAIQLNCLPQQIVDLWALLTHTRNALNFEVLNCTVQGFGNYLSEDNYKRIMNPENEKH